MFYLSLSGSQKLNFLFSVLSYCDWQEKVLTLLGCHNIWGNKGICSLSQSPSTHPFTIPYNTIPHLTIPYNTTPYHTIQYQLSPQHSSSSDPLLLSPTCQSGKEMFRIIIIFGNIFLMTRSFLAITKVWFDFSTAKRQRIHQQDCSRKSDKWILMWSFKVRLDLKTLSHWLQGRFIPSKWFASMCFFISLIIPSFPQSLQMLALRLLFRRRFSLLTMNVFSFFSSFSKVS